MAKAAGDVAEAAELVAGSDGLSALDWVVAVAAVFALAMLGWWLIKGQPLPQRPQPGK